MAARALPIDDGGDIACENEVASGMVFIPWNVEITVGFGVDAYYAQTSYNRHDQGDTGQERSPSTAYARPVRQRFCGLVAHWHEHAAVRLARMPAETCGSASGGGATVNGSPSDDEIRLPGPYPDGAF